MCACVRLCVWCWLAKYGIDIDQGLFLVLAASHFLATILPWLLVVVGCVCISVSVCV